MKLPSVKQPSDINNSKKKIQKDKNKSKFLKYKHKEGDQSKQWQIEAIVDERITIKSQPQTHSKKTNGTAQMSKSSNLMPHKMVKEYQIAWKQQSQKGIWPNSWQPQENIPDFTRLDYLLRKKSQLINSSKAKNISSFAKGRQNLQKHIELTNNKMVINPLPLDNKERRQSIKNIINHKDKDKSAQKTDKVQNYKSWYFSYNSKSQEFQKLIHRYLKGEANNQGQTKDTLSNHKSTKYSAMKQEFLDCVSSGKMQTQVLKIEQSFPTTKIPQENIIRSREYSMPKEACEKFVKDISYYLNLNQVDYFKLLLFDDSFAYISEQDLVKYFPFCYQKVMKKRIDQSIQQAQSSLSKLDPHAENNPFAKYFENIGEKIGLQRQDFDTFDSSECLFDSKRNDSKFTEMSYIFGNRQFNQEVSRQNHRETSDLYKRPIPHQNEVNKQEIQNHIETYFYYIKESAQQVEIIQHDPVQRNQLFNQKPKQNQSNQFTQCKQLFKNSFQAQKNKSNVNENQTKVKSLKLQKKEQFIKKQRKQVKNQQKNIAFENNIKIEASSERKVHKNRVKQQRHKEILQILQQSSKEKSLQKSHSKILSQENQIKQILSEFQKPRKHSDDLYDSDDQEINH